MLIACERHAHVDAVDADGELVTADRLPRKGENAFDQRHAERQVTAFGEESRERLRWCGDNQVGDSELADWLNAVEPDWYAPGSIPDDPWPRLGRHRKRQ